MHEASLHLSILIHVSTLWQPLPLEIPLVVTGDKELEMEKVPGIENSPLSPGSWLGQGNNPEDTYPPAGLAPRGGHILVHLLNSSIERQV